MTQSKIPDTWGRAPLENLLAHVIGGDWGKAPDYQNSEYQEVACIRGSEFKRWVKENGRTAVKRKVKISSLEKRSLRPGDILLEISGGGPEQPVGRTILISQAVLDQFDAPVVGTNFLRLLRPLTLLDQRFLNRHLEFFYSSGEVVRYQGGSNNLRNLKFKEYSRISIPIPPLAEQKVIADKLDTLLAQVNNTKARLERIPEMLKRFRQSVLAAAVSGRLTEEWDIKEKKLSDIASFQNGYAFKSEWFSDSGSHQVIKLGNVRNGCLDLKVSPAYVREDIANTFARFSPKYGDILISMTGTRFKKDYGFGCMVNNERNLLINQRVGRVTPNSSVISKYLSLFVQSELFRNQFFEGETGGVNQGNVGSKHIMSILIHLPTLETQTEIVRRVDRLFAYADTVERQVNSALERVNQLTQSILAKAFRGELTAQWREDNPALISGDNSAEALLERIKAERAAQAPTKRTWKKATA